MNLRQKSDGRQHHAMQVFKKTIKLYRVHDTILRQKSKLQSPPACTGIEDQSKQWACTKTTR